MWFTTTYSCGDGDGTPPDSIRGHEPAYYAVLADNTCTAPTGKVFSGWLVNSSNTVKQPGTSVGLQGNDSIIAQWSDPVNNNNNNNNAGVIPANAGCNQSVLNTTSGSAALEAIYTPNTIGTTWYSDGVQLEVDNAATSCTYDTAMTLPTNPTKAGYEFNGWKIRCNIPSTDVSNYPNAYAAKALDGGSDSAYGGATAATYGITQPGKWGISWSNGDKVTGVALCSAKSGNNHNVAWGGDSSDWTSDETTLTSATGETRYCWCKATHYTANNAQQCSLSSPSWVFVDNYSSAALCANVCASGCVSNVRSYSRCRVAVLGPYVAQ